MITSKTAFFLIVSIIILGFGIYFVSSRSSSKVDCTHCGNQKCDPVTGKCLPDPILCNGAEKPADTDSCKYSCVRGKWVCKGSDPCENSYIPSNIDSCGLADLLCDPTNKTLYCPKDTTCNGFNGYFIKGVEGTKCACDPSLGPTCKCDPKMCGDHGRLDENGECKCICNDPAHFFGPRCDQTCGVDGMINIDGTCKCDPSFYTQNGDVCTPIPCVNGTKDPKTGVCTCNSGFIAGPNGQCISKCTVNQVWDVANAKCVCKPNTDFSGVDSPTNNGTQYSPTRDGKDCDVFHCHYASEFANGKCNCKEDSCGQNCQYTRNNVCNGNGKPNCDGNGVFINCTCDAGFYGEDCSCKGLPSGVKDLIDHCKGSANVCKNGQWTTMYKDCDDIQLYFKNNGQDFQTQCFNENCNAASFYQNVGTLTCNDPSSIGQQSTFTCKGCPSNISTANCPAGQVQICDASPESNYNWVCKNQIHANGKCPPSPPSGSLCIDSNGKEASPSCFQCGPNGGSEWFCENQGSIPSMECLKNVGIESASFSGYPQQIFLNNSSSLPIYPTTDYDGCVPFMKDYNNPNNTIPYNDGQIGNFNISSNVSNPVGMINKENNTFTPIAGNRYFDIINGTSDAKCVLSDDDVAKYILKNPGKLCSGNGTFNQDKDQNGHYLPSGKCSCNQTYKGSNCQYSDAVTCNGRGTVDDNGKCTCTATYKSPIDGSTKPYFGKNCEKSDADCKVQKGGKVMYGSYNANAVCDYGNLCTNKFPRCQSCANTTDYSQMTCAKAVDGFDTANCKENPFDGTLTSTFGCPIIQDTTVWSKYTGLACNQNGNHVSTCTSGASMKGDSGFPSNCSGSPNICPLNYCSASDFTALSGAPTTDKSGLANTTVSGISLAGLPNYNLIYYLPSDNNLQGNLGSLSNDIQKACNLPNASIQNASQYPHTLRPFSS